MKKLLTAALLCATVDCYADNIAVIEGSVLKQYDTEEQKQCLISTISVSKGMKYNINILASSACGGGNHVEYWAVEYTDLKVIDVERIGGGYIFEPSSAVFDSDVLWHVDGKGWSTDDPHCCPSVSVTRRYIVNEFGITQTQ